MSPRGGVALSINQFHDLNNSNPIPQNILEQYGNNDFFQSLFKDMLRTVIEI